MSGGGGHNPLHKLQSYDFSLIPVESVLALRKAIKGDVQIMPNGVFCKLSDTAFCTHGPSRFKPVSRKEAFGAGSLAGVFPRVSYTSESHDTPITPLHRPEVQNSLDVLLLP